MIPQKCCAFIQFTSRDAAERAAERTFDQLVLKDQRIRIRWGTPRSDSNQQHQIQNRELDPVPNIASCEFKFFDLKKLLLELSFQSL